MAKTNPKDPKRYRKATTPEARQNQLISLAVDMAEEQLRNKTASSQTLNHFLQLATAKEEVKLEILRQERELLNAKTESLKSAKRIEDLYENALRAMKKYQGESADEDEDIFGIN